MDKVLGRARDSASVFLAIYGPGRAMTSDSEAARELEQIMNSGKPVIPVLVGDVGWDILPDNLRAISGVQFGVKTASREIDRFVSDVINLALDVSAPAPTQVDDPQKGQWGGKSSRNGRTLNAEVKPITEDWFKLPLRVQGAPALTDPVTFYLHPSFSPNMYTVQPTHGEAVLQMQAWGAFTVGAVADGGRRFWNSISQKSLLRHRSSGPDRGQPH